MDEEQEVEKAQRNFEEAIAQLGSQLKLIHETLEQANTLIEKYAALGSLDRIITTLVFAETAFELLGKRGHQDLLREICQISEGKCKADAGEDYLQHQLGDEFWTRVNFQTD